MIYETKSEKQYDLILLTYCDKKLQKRVLERDKMTNSLFESIVKTQLSFHEKSKYKPKIINTNKYKFFIFINIIFIIKNI